MVKKILSIYDFPFETPLSSGIGCEPTCPIVEGHLHLFVIFLEPIFTLQYFRINELISIQRSNIPHMPTQITWKLKLF